MICSGVCTKNIFDSVNNNGSTSNAHSKHDETGDDGGEYGAGEKYSAIVGVSGSSTSSSSTLHHHIDMYAREVFNTSNSSTGISGNSSTSASAGGGGGVSAGGGGSLTHHAVSGGSSAGRGVNGLLGGLAGSLGAMFTHVDDEDD